MSEPFVDTHVHFWDHEVRDLRWRFLEADFDHPRLKNTQSLDAPRYGPDDVRAEAGTEAPTKVVHVHCAQADDLTIETRFLTRLAAATRWPHAIVAAARLRDPDVARHLELQARFPLVRGVRDLTVHTGVDPDDVARAFDAAADLGLCVELMLPPEHLASGVRLADRWPTVTLVVGHTGLPTQRDPDYLAAWERALGEVARNTSTTVLKVSAVASSADPAWTVESLRPVVTTAIEVFGPGRCMFGSNWPIDRLYGTYTRLVRAYRDLIAHRTAQEQTALLWGTAHRTYGL